MKPIKFDQNFINKLKKLKNQNPTLYFKVYKQLSLFKENPRHPSLRTHELKGKLKNVFSISVDRSFRLVYIKNGEYLFFDLGFHSQIYKD
ncbi:MAG TPA: type II toxin-antitoxin system mRNA interferase toxin, RelE/StbE family [Candidatus Woesebacteria bacterium]|nr:type II toxin-antitoxin system mRNA interferase toxin, RelE/StbE family [Candidatus Woesebacteria bacterium]